MKLFNADYETLHDVPGVPGRVRKPVNLDGAEIGFGRLRSLRLYRFDAGTVIHGHAEQDEVFVILTRGSVEMKIGFTDEVVDGFGTFPLTAPDDASSEDLFVAYLPPRSVYRMIPRTEADVFYARATPSEARVPAVFRAAPMPLGEAEWTIFENRDHAERLRVRVQRVMPHATEATLPLVEPGDQGCEALVHLQTQSMAEIGSVSRGIMEPLRVHSADTLALAPGETPLLQLRQGTAVTIVAVMAC